MTEEKNKEELSGMYRILFERRDREKSRKFDCVLDFFWTFAFYYCRLHLYLNLCYFCNFGNFCCVLTNKVFLPSISVINSVYLFVLIIIIIPILYYIDQFKIIPAVIVLSTLFLPKFIIWMPINILPYDHNAMILVIFIIILILFWMLSSFE